MEDQHGALCPRRLARAFRAGLGCRNLYGLRASAVLEDEIEAVARRVGVEPPPPPGA